MKISISAKWSGPGKSHTKLQNLTADALSNLYNFDELEPKDQKFWFTYLKKDPETCSIVARYLERISKLNDAGPNKHTDNVTLEKEIALKLASYAGIRNYTKVYRGFEVDEPEKYKKGGLFDLNIKRDSHWSQLEDEADAVASGVGTSLVVEMRFDKNDVVVDLNIVPWACGPIGREPELILGPVNRKVKIVSVYL